MYEQIENHINNIPCLTGPDRAKLREACLKGTCLDEFNLDNYDRERLRILCAEAAYQRRVKGQIYSGPAFQFAARTNYFDSQKPVMQPLRIPL